MCKLISQIKIDICVAIYAKCNHSNGSNGKFSKWSDIGIYKTVGWIYYMSRATEFRRIFSIQFLRILYLELNARFKLKMLSSRCQNHFINQKYHIQKKKNKNMRNDIRIAYLNSLVFAELSAFPFNPIQIF